MPEVSRDRVLAYRARVHDLATAGDGAAALGVGLQDYPPGRSAGPSLALRTGSPVEPEGLALVHGARGALHLHRAADLPLLRAALRIETAEEWAKQTLGPFGTELVEAGATFGAAQDQVAGVMGEVMAGGVRRTKGELSEAVSPLVDRLFAPWCEGCGVHHVHDLLFRAATLRAGLTVEVDHTTPSQFRYLAAGPATSEGTDASRAELVRRFLAAFGPARPAHLAAWAGLRPAAAREWLELVADELRPVRVEGREHRVHADDLDRLVGAEAVHGTRLVPAYDPLLELADRDLLVGRADLRRRVWQAAANPGVLWLDGEIEGVWRVRRTPARLTVTVEPFGVLAARRRRALDADLETLRLVASAPAVDVRFA